jgi:PAS domain S-box-containing protein
MKRLRNQSWLFPNCLFIFFSLYLFVKFIFILFFSAAYEPKVIFEFTPCYLLAGVNNIQLLVLTLVVMVSDLYLHLQSGRRQLLLSFIPTAIMLSGIGTSIMTNQMDLTYAYHYVIFGCLLLVVLIDYNFVLSGEKYPTRLRKKEQRKSKAIESYGTPFLSKKYDVSYQDLTHVLPATTSEFKEVTDGFLQKMEAVLESLERKTQRIEALDHTIEDGQRNFINHEKLFTDRILYNLETLEKIHSRSTNIERSVSAENKIYDNKKIQHPSIDDQTNDFVVIVKRGIIKEISSSFAEFLGYRPTELLEKNFFMFVSPRTLEDSRKFYVERLKGTSLNSFRTSLLSKGQQELLVNVTVTPTTHNGDTAEFLHIVVIPDNSLSTIQITND